MKTLTEKPVCQLIGEDSNVFNLIGIASRCLKKAGLKDEATHMAARCFKSGGYDEVLNIIGEYVEIE